MSIHSSKTGKFSINGGTSAMASVREVNIDYTTELPSGNASGANQGAPFSVPGPKDFTGDISIYGKTFNMLPGADFSFESFNGTEIATGDAVVQSLDLRCSIESGGLLSGTIRFGGNGVLTLDNSGTSMTDANVPQAYGGIVCKAAWGPAAASPTMLDIEDVTEWTLSYECNVNAYVTSGTAPWHGRNAGALSRLEATVSVLNSEPSGLVLANMGPGQYGELRLYVTATEFFAIRWMGVQGLRQGQPIESGGNPTVQATMSWSSYTDLSGTQTVGYIKNPAAATIWP